MLNCGMVRFPTGHHWHCNWPVQKASPGMCPCKWWTFEHFVNKLLQTICIFHVFLVQVASVHRVRFLLCWRLMVDKRTLLNCRALIKFVKERTKSKMLFCLVLINLCTYFHVIWHICCIGDKKSLETFYMHAKCKFLIFKFSKVMQQHT